TRPPSVTFEAVGEGSSLVIPNAALIAWVERVTGKDLGQLFTDEEGQESDPWGEVNAIVGAVTKALGLATPPALSPETACVPTPRAEAEDASTPGVAASAVIGLFPAANQGLLSDLEALDEGAPVVGPIESFLKAGADLGVRRDGEARK